MRTRKEALQALEVAHRAPRCLAWTKMGGICRQAAVKGRKRCRMHGGAPGSGAPKGNQNRLVHGHFTSRAIATRRMVRALLRSAQDLTD